jgi:hypothetical protein
VNDVKMQSGKFEILVQSSLDSRGQAAAENVKNEKKILLISQLSLTSHLIGEIREIEKFSRGN